MADTNPYDDAAERRARIEGRREGMATAALCLALCSFFNLLGAEKALLAIVLAALASRAPRAARAWRRARFAIAVATVYIVTVVAVLVAFHDRLGQLLGLLHTLG